MNAANTKQRRRHRPLVRIARRTRPGAMPGTLATDPQAARPEMSATVFGPGLFEEHAGCGIEDIERLRGRGAVLWLDVTGLGDAQLIERLGTAFGLHRLSLEDVINVHQRPKAEFFEAYAFIVARMVVPHHGADTEQVSMFLGPDFVLTFQERHGDCFDPVRARLRSETSRIRQHGADYLAYALLDAVIDGYYPVIEQLGEDIEALEDEVIATPHPGQVDDIHGLKRDLLGLRRAIWPTREMVNALIRDEGALINAETRVYLRDCYDHAIQLMDVVETYREIASSLLDAYLSSMSTKLNEIMKVLTIIATIFIPLSFVASLYGMNFDTGSPWNLPELGWRYGYPAVLLVMLGITGGLLFWFRRRGWLGGGPRRRNKP